MDTTKKHDWGLIVAGILLVVCAFFFLVAPGLTLVTITAIAVCAEDVVECLPAALAELVGAEGTLR